MTECAANMYKMEGQTQRNEWRDAPNKEGRVSKSQEGARLGILMNCNIEDITIV